MTFKNIICPISKQTADNAVVRSTGFLVASLAGLYAFTGSIYFILILFIDFSIRGFTKMKFSPLSWLSKQIVDGLNINGKKIDKAPKVFAARVGFAFSLVALILFYINPFASMVVTLILMSFAILESVFGFCLGCVVYTYLVLPIYRT